MTTRRRRQTPGRPASDPHRRSLTCSPRSSANVERVIQGKPEVIELALVSLVAEGHVLHRRRPGVGKTSLAKALAASVDCTFGRVQFTPDLLPSDVVGMTVWNRGSGEFEFRPGPIFANIVLGDEINRASPKTQSALLEAMGERPGHRRRDDLPLETPFMVIATQNPIEHEGTYPLPESQLDRFLMRVAIGYPDRGAELEILDTHGDHSTLEEHAAGRHRRGRAGDGERGANRARCAEPEGLSRRHGRGQPPASAVWPSACRPARRSACSAPRERWPPRTGATTCCPTM